MQSIWASLSISLWHDYLTAATLVVGVIKFELVKDKGTLFTANGRIP